MDEVLPDSQTDPHVRLRRQAPIRTCAPDWLFSAVVHLLLVGLLLTSQAGPGGGGGDGGGATGPGGDRGGDFPGDGWIEAQVGSESTVRGAPAIAIEPPDEVTVAESHPISPVPVRDDIENAPGSVIVQTTFTEPARPTPPSENSADVATAPAAAVASGPPGRSGSAGGGAGLGRGHGDGSPGEGGHGQGGTSLFGIWDSGERIVYVIDRSSSMGHYEKLVAARRELEASLARLDESFEFQVLYYNQQVHALNVHRSRGLVRASAINKHQVRRQIGLVTAEGGTRHRTALRAALELRPTVIYFLTDAEADGLTAGEIAELSRNLRGATRIHCIQFGDMPGETPTAGNWLEELAAATGGQYVHFRTEALQRAERQPAGVP